MKINTGKGYISLAALLAIWSVSAVTSLPGLAISPILGDMNSIFPKASDLEIQMLTSLPSLLIIPFMLLSGHLSAKRGKLPLLATGLLIFFISGVACFIAKSIATLIIASCTLGIGAGIIVPLSTGLVVDYFTGAKRVNQLGYSSAINNLTLVAATALTGYVADINWHLSFIVYLLPGVSLIMILALRNTSPAPEPQDSDQLKQQNINLKHLALLTLFYFVITFVSLVVTFDLAFLFEKYHIEQSLSGVAISIFFLSIMLPGLFLNRLIGIMRGFTNIIALALLAIGLFVIAWSHDAPLSILGAALAGLGYGVMQPLIYDKAAIIAPPRLATKALAIVMSANYLAIILCPFIVDAARYLLHDQSKTFPFMFNGIVAVATLIIALLWRNNFVLGLDNSYYTERK